MKKKNLPTKILILSLICSVIFSLFLVFLQKKFWGHGFVFNLIFILIIIPTTICFIHIIRFCLSKSIFNKTDWYCIERTDSYFAKLKSCQIGYKIYHLNDKNIEELYNLLLQNENHENITFYWEIFDDKKLSHTKFKCKVLDFSIDIVLTKLMKCLDSKDDVVMPIKGSTIFLKADWSRFYCLEFLKLNHNSKIADDLSKCNMNAIAKALLKLEIFDVYSSSKIRSYSKYFDYFSIRKIIGNSFLENYKWNLVNHNPSNQSETLKKELIINRNCNINEIQKNSSIVLH